MLKHTEIKHTNEIKFYGKNEDYYEFTNFYPYPVTIDGKQWPTTEHYFQAQKFIGTPYVEYIRNLASPREAFQFSRERKVSKWIRSDWYEIKDDIMKLALLHKFGQNDKMRDRLIDTGNKRLVEHTWNDSYWGDGGDGSGKNMLGKLLMEVRATLKPKAKPLLGKRHSFSGRAFRALPYGGSNPSNRHDKIVNLDSKQTMEQFPPIKTSLWRSVSLDNFQSKKAHRSSGRY